MDDSAAVMERNAGLMLETVVRRFSPVRIERLLLTRLFDLATGQIPDASADPRAGAMSEDGVSHHPRKEAA